MGGCVLLLILLVLLWPVLPFLWNRIVMIVSETVSVAVLLISLLLSALFDSVWGWTFLGVMVIYMIQAWVNNLRASKRATHSNSCVDVDPQPSKDVDENVEDDSDCGDVIALRKRKPRRLPKRDPETGRFKKRT